MRSTAFAHLRHLTIWSAIPGIEVLLDDGALPVLRSICGLLVPLFVTLMRRSDPMKALNSIEYLRVVDQRIVTAGTVSLKHWYLLFDVFPCLHILRTELRNAACPSMTLLDLFVSYIKYKARAPLTFFSLSMDSANQSSAGHGTTPVPSRPVSSRDGTGQQNLKFGGTGRDGTSSVCLDVPLDANNMSFSPTEL